MAILDDVADRLPADPAQRQLESEAAISQLRAYQVEHASPGSPVAVVARALAIAPAVGLTTKEIHDSTGHLFAVRPVLDAHQRLFTAGAAGRWLLGVPPVPPV